MTTSNDMKFYIDWLTGKSGKGNKPKNQAKTVRQESNLLEVSRRITGDFANQSGVRSVSEYTSIFEKPMNESQLDSWGVGAGGNPSVQDYTKIFERTMDKKRIEPWWDKNKNLLQEGSNDIADARKKIMGIQPGWSKPGWIHSRPSEIGTLALSGCCLYPIRPGP